MAYTYKELKKAAKFAKSDTSRPLIRVAIIGDTATQCLSTCIVGEAYLRGYVLNLYEADYNQVERQVLDPSSELHKFNPDYTVIFQSSHKLLEHYSKLTEDKRYETANQRLEFITQLCSSISGRIIYYNYAEIEDSVFGSFANNISSSYTYQLRKINFELMNIAEKNANLFICDLSAIQNIYGRNFMYDAPVYMNTEMIINIDALPLVSARTIDILSAAEGKFKKCLICDLDNTLWGGVVGDEGWEGIQIGHGLGDGKAFSELQQWIKKLKDRGIIIAICSKNDEDKAKEPFEKNPEMVLKLDDIAVFIANWENKADNIRTIQSILNIGFDSMVFLDDNPAEREIVRRELGSFYESGIMTNGVTVPELPNDPSHYLEYLYSLNLFETTSFSMGDKDRTKQYQVEAQRMTQQKHFTNEADFLKSLEMVGTVSNFNKYNIPRVAQLSQRSNQFNLRTIRYTEDQITAIEDDPHQKGFAFTLEDKFGDNGLIAVVILQQLDSLQNHLELFRTIPNHEQALFVDTWFMSCRVLKRGMENFTLNTIVKYAKANGYKKIIGEYLPTAKNGMVADHYPNLGLTPVPEHTNGLWMLSVDDFQNKECYIKNK